MLQGNFDQDPFVPKLCDWPSPPSLAKVSTHTGVEMTVQVWLFHSGIPLGGLSIQMAVSGHDPPGLMRLSQSPCCSLLSLSSSPQSSVLAPRWLSRRQGKGAQEMQSVGVNLSGHRGRQDWSGVGLGVEITSLGVPLVEGRGWECYVERICRGFQQFVYY